MVAEVVQSDKALGCNTSLKVHFLQSHIGFFSENLSAVSDKHGQQFHQEISTTENRCQGKWSSGTLAGYC
jgi:hypothetical protein